MLTRTRLSSEQLEVRDSKTSHGISIEGKNVDGINLRTFLFPNPLNLKKYIVEIGMNQWKAVKGWRLHLPRNGVCDYFVFDLQKPARD